MSGIELPKAVEQALALEVEIGNTLWADSKELEKVRVAFEILPDEKKAPIHLQFVQCHIVFDIKIEDFRYKARLVSGDQSTSNYYLCQYCV